MENDCAFCNRINFEERLIAENSACYAVAALGQITGGHVFIIPKMHVPCMGALAPHHSFRQMEEIRKMTEKAYHALKKEYPHGNRMVLSPVIMFEDTITEQRMPHANLHIIPIAVDLTKKIRADFPKAEIKELKDTPDLQKIYRDDPKPYLFWTTPDGHPMMCIDPVAPPHYLHIITAKLLGYPERADLRTMNRTLDRALWEKTVSSLKLHLTE